MEINRLLRLLVTAALMFSGVYLWKSGLPQISHLLYPIIFILVLLTGRLKINLPIVFLFVFTLYCVFLNMFYWYQTKNHEFLISGVQICFTSLIYWFLYSLLVKDDKLPANLISGVLLGLILQWAVLWLGIGNYKFEPRYSGSFNDPNQMGYWVTVVCSIYWVYSILEENKTKRFWKYFVFMSFVVFTLMTMSRSVLITIPFFILFYTYHSKLFLSVYILFALPMLMLALVGFSLINFDGNLNLENLSKFTDRVSVVDVYSELQLRGYTRPLEYPEYILWGAGHGEHERFNGTAGDGHAGTEVHSSFVGLLFYYGIVGTSLFIVFIYLSIKHVPTSALIILLITFVFGLTTYSLRTPIFWVLLAFITSYSYRKGALGEQ
mgnify:CR=1 FL=1